MITTNYNYRETLAAAVKANWRVEDIIGGDKRLDFTRPFMPDSLARVNSMEFLSSDEKILLNQIRGYGYLSTFIIVEEFILPFVLDHVRVIKRGKFFASRPALDRSDISPGFAFERHGQRPRSDSVGESRGGLRGVED